MLKDMVKKIPGARRVAQTLGLAPIKSEPRRFLLEMLPKESVGAEIGVHTGGFSQRLLEVVNPKELRLIDPWKHESSATYREALYGGKVKNGQNEMDKRYSDVCARFDQEIRAERVKIHRGYSTNILAQFPDEYFDWVYIDGNHLYEYVKNDIELSFRKTKVGGYITGDDYTKGGWWEGGVTKAVDEYTKAESAQLVDIHNGQFIFHKKS